MPKNIQNVRQDILYTAKILLKEEGYSKLNMRNVALKCGIGLGTFYNYFSSKQDLLVAIIESDWDIAVRRMDMGIKTGTAPLDKLGSIFGELREFTVSVHGIWLNESPDDIIKAGMGSAHTRKTSFREKLAGRISVVLTGIVSKEEEAFLSDFIARIFVSYAYDNNVNYEALKPVLAKLL